MISVTRAARPFGPFLLRGRTCFAYLDSHASVRRRDTAARSTPPDGDYWERMYNSGGATADPAIPAYFLDGAVEYVPGDGIPAGDGAPPPAEVRVVTFDLDDTLWRTAPVITAANTALESHLDELFPETAGRRRRVTDAMRKLYTENPAAYAPAFVPDGDRALPESGPVLLTALRTDAVREICAEDPVAADDPRGVALRAFERWTEARHAAILEHAAPSGAAAALERIRAGLRPRRGGSSGRIVVGAITNGNSDPRRVPSLAPYFDFLVQSEQVGVSKPDPAVFAEATRIVARDFPDAIPPEGMPGPEEGYLAGNWWVHVGDDFLKDCAAAKAVGMRTVWARELILPPPLPPSTADPGKASSADAAVDATRFDDRRDPKTGIIRMNMGADDYLAESVGSEFVDARIERIADLPDVLMQWQGEADAFYDVLEGMVATAKEDAAQPEEVVETPKSMGAGIDLNDGGVAGKKFCIHCGNSLPATARFCSSCGQSQE